MFQFLVLLILLGLGIGFQFLPWQGKLIVFGLVLLFFVAVWLFGVSLLEALFLWLFRLKGAVLKRARSTVHKIEPIALSELPTPPEELPDGEVPKPEPLRHYYLLEVTITPGWAFTPFTHWDMSDLQLVLPSYRPMTEDDDNSCKILDNRVILPSTENESEMEDYDFHGKVSGPHRLRLLLGVIPGTERLVFNYYFGKFGEVMIPPYRVPVMPASPG